ncbi:hypothetical protein J7E29_16790 [Streptomyces sp. ISL-90]|nr:hypothetical protein [Streptomyces sp. ISL-90]
MADPYEIPADRSIDPSRLQAWIDMNTVTGKNPNPGASFIYRDDLLQGFRGHVNPDHPASIVFEVTADELAEAQEVARELGVSVDELAYSAFGGYMDGVRAARRGDVD